MEGSPLRRLLLLDCDQGPIISIDRNLSLRKRRHSLLDPFSAESGKAHPWQIMQEMVDIPAAMPAGTDEADSKRHSCHILFGWANCSPHQMPGQLKLDP